MVDVDSAALAAALRALQRREYGRQELEQKLLRQGYDKPQVTSVLHHLAAQDLQSDQRFVEAYLHSRARRGYGPLAIRYGLQGRGVDATLIEQLLPAEMDPYWQTILQRAYLKKYVDAIGNPPLSHTAFQYLQRRGFSAQQIKQFLCTPT